MGACGGGAADPAPPDAYVCTSDPYDCERCNPLDPDSCPDGTTCTDGGDFAESCRAIGSAAPGEACTVDPDCAAASQCIVGACRAYCETNGDCDGGLAGDTCQTVHAGHARCAASCSVVAADDGGCGAGFECVGSRGAAPLFEGPDGEESEWLPFCVTAGYGGDAQLGEACTETYACGPGMICLETCLQLCDPDAPVCTTGACDPFGDVFVASGETAIALGVCR